jgi:hypothetical protein
LDAAKVGAMSHCFLINKQVVDLGKTNSKFTAKHWYR